MERFYSWKRAMVALAATVALMVSVAVAAPTSAHGAHAQEPTSRLTACSSGRSDAYPPMNGYSGYMDLINIGSSSCGGGPANSDTYANNCSGRSFWTAQADTWLTQQPYSGGTRLSESGRSSLVSYPNDCKSYHVNNTYLWFPPSPLYSCAWWYVKESNWSKDYVCNSGAS